MFYLKIPFFIFTLTCFSIFCPLECPSLNNIPLYPQNPFIIHLDIPAPEDSAGSMIVADLDGDKRMDYLVTRPGYLACYRWDGEKLWILNVDIRVGGSAETYGLPGHHGPGVQAGDIDGDGKTEVLFLTNDSVLHIVEGKTGKEKWSRSISVPEGAERWEHLAIVNLEGKGDTDIVLQATNKEGYRMGRFVSAYSLEKLKEGKQEPLWSTDNFLACAHNGLRVADLDGDNRDEIISGCIIAPDGKEIFRLPDLQGHLDSVFIADIRPDIPGLEVVTLEEGANRVFLFGMKGMIWTSDNQRQEPQNAAVGEFELNLPGLEIWCRSRYDTDQKPWVFDANGKIIADYEMRNVAPSDWTNKGIEVINSIYWDGTDRQYICAKERHEAGDVAVIDPITGNFLHRFTEKADRLYVADVAGDWREEIIVLDGNQLHIYQNEEKNPNPKRARLWKQPLYRRLKSVWNYYSP